MHRRISILIAMLVIVSLAAWGMVYAQAQDCSVTPCVYIPLIRFTPSLHVRSYRMFPDGIGDLIVTGEIENGTSKPAYNVKVIGKFYSSTGAFVGTNYTYALLDLIDPGQRAPFRLYLDNAPSDVTRVDLTLSSGTVFLTYRYAAIISQQTRDNSGVEVFGEVQNVAAKDLKYTKVVVIFYDATGVVYNVDYSYAALTQIPPGGTSTYSVSTFDSSLTGLAYTIQAQGYLAP